MRHLLTLFVIAAVLLAGCFEESNSDTSEQSESTVSSRTAEESNAAESSSADDAEVSEFTKADALEEAEEMHETYRTHISGFGSFQFENRQPKWTDLSSEEKELVGKFYWPHNMLHQIPSEHIIDEEWQAESSKPNPLKNSGVPLEDSTIVERWEDVPDGVINPSSEPGFGDVTMVRVTGSDFEAFKKNSAFGHPKTAWAVVVEVHGKNGRLIHRVIQNALEEGAGPDVETEVTKGEDGTTEVRFN